DPHQILVGSGTSELLQLLALAFLRPGERVLVLAPTYGEYARACLIMEAQVKFRVAGTRAGFAVDPAAVARELRAHAYRLVFVCNPNNPTGQALADGTL